MSVETLPKPIPNPLHQPSEAHPGYDAAADPHLKNDLATDVAVKMTEQDYIDAGYWVEAPPTDTSELLPEDYPGQEWIQHQPPSPDAPHIGSTLDKVRANTTGLVGGLARSLWRGEDYDPTKHNRVVQKAMYENVGSVAVREHLAAHDTKRFDQYAEGKTTKAERVGAVLRDVAAVAPALGLIAVGKLGRLLAEKSEPEAIGTHWGRAVDVQSGRVLDALDKNNVRESSQQRSRNLRGAAESAQDRAKSRAVSA